MHGFTFSLSLSLQVLREMVSNIPENQHKKVIIDTLVVTNASIDLNVVSRSEARVFLLYSTHEEAIEIMSAAQKLGLTGKAYVWIVTQSVIGSNLEAPKKFPIGMLGVHFKTDRETMVQQIHPAMSILGR